MLFLVLAPPRSPCRTSWNTGGTLVEPWWNPGGTLPQGRPGPPRSLSGRPQSFQLLGKKCQVPWQAPPPPRPKKRRRALPPKKNQQQQNNPPSTRTGQGARKSATSAPIASSFTKSSWAQPGEKGPEKLWGPLTPARNGLLGPRNMDQNLKHKKDKAKVENDLGPPNMDQNKNNTGQKGLGATKCGPKLVLGPLKMDQHWKTQGQMRSIPFGCKCQVSSHSSKTHTASKRGFEGKPPGLS